MAPQLWNAQVSIVLYNYRQRHGSNVLLTPTPVTTTLTQAAATRAIAFSSARSLSAELRQLRDKGNVTITSRFGFHELNHLTECFGIQNRLQDTPVSGSAVYCYAIS